jgi:hypothetical protein
MTVGAERLDRHLKKQSQFARRWREIRSTKLEMRKKQTTNPS